MKVYSQYGEENVILSFFENKKKGKLVDIGAADGIKNSNSRCLIEQFDWTGILVEPHPTFYNQLEKLYANNKNIILKNIAVYNKIGVMPFYAYGFDNHEPAQVSTLSETFKDKVSTIYGDKYEKSISVNVDTLENVLKENVNCDFLSIDCEGVDMDVLHSNNWSKYRPSLICVEHSMSINILDSYMLQCNYRFHNRTHGNSFYVNNQEKL